MLLGWDQFVHDLLPSGVHHCAAIEVYARSAGTRSVRLSLISGADCFQGNSKYTCWRSTNLGAKTPDCSSGVPGSQMESSRRRLPRAALDCGHRSRGSAKPVDGSVAIWLRPFPPLMWSP